MKLKFTLVDTSQKGIARHLPSFAKAKHLLETTFETYLEKRAIRRMVLNQEFDRLIEKMREFPATVKYVTKLLNDDNATVRWCASRALANATEKEIDISIAIPNLVNLLRDERADVRYTAAGALDTAAKNKIDISAAIPALGNALMDEYEVVRYTAAWALGAAAENGIDISIAIPNLVNALIDKNADARQNAYRALRNAVWNSNERTRTAITKAVMDFQGSKWFAIEAAKNSPQFIRLIGQLDRILKEVRKAERREVA